MVYFFQDLGFRDVMVNESRTASCLGLEKEESEEMNKPFTVVSTTNSLNFSESGWWGRILSGNENTDSNFDRFVAGGVRRIQDRESC